MGWFNPLPVGIGLSYDTDIIFLFLFANLTSWKWSGKLDLILCSTQCPIIKILLVDKLTSLHRYNDTSKQYAKLNANSTEELLLWVTMCSDFFVFNPIFVKNCLWHRHFNFFTINLRIQKKTRTHSNSKLKTPQLNSS